jgi:hypothetical protein
MEQTIICQKRPQLSIFLNELLLTKCPAEHCKITIVPDQGNQHGNTAELTKLSMQMGEEKTTMSEASDDARELRNSLERNPSHSQQGHPAHHSSQGNPVRRNVPSSRKTEKIADPADTATQSSGHGDSK